MGGESLEQDGTQAPAVAATLVTNPAQAAEGKAGELPSSGAMVKKAEETIHELVTLLPPVVTWCVVFVLCFVGTNLVMGKATRAWRK